MRSPTHIAGLIARTAIALNHTLTSIAVQARAVISIRGGSCLPPVRHDVSRRMSFAPKQPSSAQRCRKDSIHGNRYR
jgi:hypothetical protein